MSLVQGNSPFLLLDVNSKDALIGTGEGPLRARTFNSANMASKELNLDSTTCSKLVSLCVRGDREGESEADMVERR